MSGAGHIPKVSVLTTLYNKGLYVEEAVHSVLAQTFTDFELLVVDDASTDGGPEQVKAIGDPRIRVLENAVNTGRPSAANRGLDAARGEYVAVLDADDRMVPERLAKQVAFLESRPEIGACGSWLQAFGSSDRLYRKPAGDAHIRAGLLLGMQLPYPSCMVRRPVLEAFAVRCDPRWLTPGMDHLFLVKLGLHAGYANIQEALTQYRVGEQNMDHGRDRTADRLPLLEETLRLVGIPATHEEAALHLMLANMHTAPPTPRRVRALAAWLQQLKAFNRRTDTFPVAEFEEELDRLWGKTFHGLADRSTAAGWAQMRINDPWNLRKAWYLFRTAGRTVSSPAMPR